MIERLRQPGGRLGTATVWLAAILGVVGLLGVTALLIALATDSSFWSDRTSDKWWGVVFFGLTALGGVGFLVMDRNRVLGATLAVVGGIALALVLVWAVLPVIVGLAAAVVAVMRARALAAAPAKPV